MAKAPAKKRSRSASGSSKTASKPKTAATKAEPKPPQGLFAHIWAARRGLRASYEAQVAQGISEERLLAYVAFACLMAFVARLPSVLNVAQQSGEGVSTPGLVAGSFVAFVIFAPLFLYGVAGLSHLVAARVFGGEGSYAHARLALFWSLVLAVPLGLLWALIVQGLRLGGSENLIEPLGLVVFALWLWIWTSLLAMAEGFSRMAVFGLVLIALVSIAGILSLLG